MTTEQDKNPQPREWTRKEMLLHGGTSWFYLVIAYYVLQDAWWIISDADSLLYYVPKSIIWIASLAMLIGGLGMLFGLFWRPAWRGWKWASFVAIGAAGQILYTYLYYDSWLYHALVTPPEIIDNLSFSIFICLGYFRAIVDLFLQKKATTKYHCPKPFCGNRG
jgi:hypothetical protein